MTSPLLEGQYASSSRFFTGENPSNVVGGDDQTRIKAYRFYDNCYHNRPQAFSLTLRGEDDEQIPIQLPSPKKLIDAINRFFGIEFQYTIQAVPETAGQAVTVDQAAMDTLDFYMRKLFKREKLPSKWESNKRNGLVRGDALWHITADDTKDEGQRISIHVLNPGNYFPIMDLFDPNRVAGCYLVDIVQDPRAKDDKTKTVARVQKYWREQDSVGAYTGKVFSQLDLFEIGKWDDRNLKPGDISKVQSLKPPTQLPDRITQLPVYHWRNRELDEYHFGNSELAGIETIFYALNQGISDEDLTLVMQGLGMYWTNAGPPQDADGNEVGWQLGPRQVVEVGDNQTFGRATGVSSVAPFLDHLKYIDDYGGNASGISDIATGRVDVAVAESGISLQLQLQPLLANNASKELDLINVHDQLLYDLTHMWLPAYEGIDYPMLEVTTYTGDPMPTNRDAQVLEVIGLVSNVPPLITMQMAVDRLTKLGWQYPDNPVEAILADSARVSMAADPTLGSGELTGEAGSGSLGEEPPPTEE